MQNPVLILSAFENQPQRPKVLIVDDSDFLLKITVNIIDKIRLTLMLNFDILTSENGEDAYQKYVQHHKDIKMILMDIHMPIMNGYDSTLKIREFEELNGIEPQTYIVGLSAEESSQHERRCKVVQMNESISKPITRNQVEQLLIMNFT